MAAFEEIQRCLRDADMRLDTHDNRVQRRLAFPCIRQQGDNLRRDHGEQRLVDVGADVRARKVLLQFADCVAQTGPVLGRYIQGGLEGRGCFEQFGACVDAKVGLLVLDF